MTFLAPIWLVGLFPWAAVTIALLQQRRRRTEVPFLPLWEVEAPDQKVTHHLNLPPIPLLACIAAMLLAVLAAAAPVVVRSNIVPPLVVMIVDRGVTMSPPGRTEKTIERANKELTRAFGTLPPMSTGNYVEPDEYIQAQLRDSDPPVVVISDRKLAFDSPRLIQFAPDTANENVGIVHVAARGSEILVRLRNDSNQKSAALKFDGRSIAVELPERGGEKEYFIDANKLEQIVSVELAAKDDIQADNRAWLVRQGSWPILEARPGLSESLQRMIDVYRKSRPPGDGGRHVTIGDSAADVLIVPANSPESVDSAKLRVADHPINREVDWTKIGSRVSVGPSPGSEWTPIVRLGDATLVAVREQPTRQVRVAFDSSSWPATPEFVVFWTNVFDWVGRGGSAYVAETVHRLGQEWREWSAIDASTPGPIEGLPSPGVYRRDDGALRAINALPVRIEPLPITDPNVKLAALVKQSGGQISLSPYLNIAAIGLILLAAVTWPRRNLTVFSHPRTV